MPRVGRRASSVVATLVAAGFVVAAAVVPERPTLYLVYAGALAAAVAGVVAGLLRGRVPRHDPWWLLVGGIASIAVQIALVAADVVRTKDYGGSGGPQALLQLCGYVLVIAASDRLVRRRGGRGDRDGLIDAAIVGCAAGVVLWQWTAPSGPGVDVALVVLGALPAAFMATVLALSVRLVLVAADVVAARLIAAATIGTLAGNLVNLGPKLVGELSRVAVVCWVVAQAALVIAAWHPSRRELSRPGRSGPVPLLTRLGVLGLALAAIPVSTAVATPGARIVPVAGTVLVTALVLWRLGRSLHERERRGRHQALLFEFGRVAVTGDLDTIFGVACDVAARIAAGPCLVLEFAAGAEGPAVVRARSGDWSGLGPDGATLPGSGDDGLTRLTFGGEEAPYGAVVVRGPKVPADAATLAALAQVLGAGVRRVRAEATLVHASMHDALTELPNRVLLYDRLQSRMRRAERSSEPFVVMFVDLDGFKAVNDSLGHAAGDAILVATAQRLRSCARTGDTVARVSGDEFVVLLESGGAEVGESVARRIAAALAEPVPVADGVAAVSASIGAVVVPSPVPPSLDVDRVLRDADELMYRVKRSGRNGFRLQELQHQRRADEVTRSVP